MGERTRSETDLIRVLHLIPSLNRGGAERALISLATASSDERHRIVTMRGGTMIPEFVARGGSLLDLGLTGGFSLGLLPCGISRAIAEYRPNIVHAWMYHAGLIAGIMPIDVPLVIGIRRCLDSNAGLKLRTKLVIRALAPISSRAAAVVYPSERAWLQHEVIGYSKRRPFVLPNGFDGALFRPDANIRDEMRKVLGIGDQELVLGHVARFHPIKNQRALIRCFGSAARHRPNIRLLLAGDGLTYENSALAEQITSGGLTRDRVLLLGPRSDISRLLAALDGFALPSLSEAFPNSLVEAMLTGLVAIASDVGDVQKILGENGFLIPADDESALRCAIERWADLSAAERQMVGVAARRWARSRYGRRRFVSNHSKMYRAVLGLTEFPSGVY